MNPPCLDAAQGRKATLDLAASLGAHLQAITCCRSHGQRDNVGPNVEVPAVCDLGIENCSDDRSGVAPDPGSHELQASFTMDCRSQTHVYLDADVNAPSRQRVVPLGRDKAGTVVGCLLGIR